MDASTPFLRTLAIDPTASGFAFVVLEDPRRIVDWGVAKIWAASDNEFLARIEGIVERYAPSRFVVEESEGSRRGVRARRRIGLLLRYAQSQGMVTSSVSRTDVRESMGMQGATKQEIATKLARHFPELETFLPAPRRPWESEDPRMNIFDALSFAIAPRGFVHKETSAELGNS